MISILIPVYNVNVTALVRELSRQLQSTKQPGEIIVLDDGSSGDYTSINKSLDGLAHTRFIHHEQNAGRIQARSQLAESASNEWLLFIDGDSQVIRADFLNSYLNTINDGRDVIVGGRIYQQFPPSQCNLRLHWKYGTARERIIVEKRKREPYYGFMSNNFLITKKAFRQLRFNEGLEGYGHEDTWIGIQLEKLRTRVSYIDNPVLHLGIEPADTFISKTHSALKNLKVLSTIVDASTLKRHVKLYRHYERVEKKGGLKLIEAAYALMKSRIAKNLVSCSPSLKLFDLYRMNYFIQLMKTKSILTTEDGRSSGSQSSN